MRKNRVGVRGFMVQGNWVGKMEVNFSERGGQKSPPAFWKRKGKKLEKCGAEKASKFK
jgi:hypothetical protein